jgi:polysaccharide pyruvyl transferase WcaK-like protein
MEHRRVRILVEPSDYVLGNVGDMAMLAVATERLASLFPTATITVLTDDPEPLMRLCPGVTPLLADGRALWLSQEFLPRRVLRHLPKRWAPKIRHSMPQLVTVMQRCTHWRNAAARESLSTFTRAVREADLVLVAGMGGITDAFSKYASDVLETLDLSLRNKCRVIMVGQGVGPLEHPDLRARAAAILPRLDLIGVREKRASTPVLHALGVPGDRIVATGDDAIEMAYSARRQQLGRGIGVNVRLSSYSGLDESAIDGLRGLLAEICGAIGTSLVPVPISHAPKEDDLGAIRHLMPRHDPELERARSLRTPIEVVRQVQRCRVVVTGSYHAGVFALASGIPTIGLAKSAYYIDKFKGLADMFGCGCEVIVLDQESNLEALRASLLRLWEAAPELRPRLLERAAAQIAMGHAAYRRIHDIVMGAR